LKVEVGYITSWRRAIFFTFVACIIVFGIVSTLSQTYIGAGFVSNIIGVAVLMVCILIFLLVYADKWNRYSGTGTAVISDGVFVYNDKKRHYSIPLSDITGLDIQNIRISNENSVSGNAGTPIAYRIMIKTARKKYYIESDRAGGRAYNEVDLHRLYIFLQEARN
jgi:hypothetical protein